MRDVREGLHPDGRRIRLLVVENEIATIFALRSFFALGGFEVDCAQGPYDGLQLIERQAYDAVVTDLQLTPGGSNEGFDLAARARERNPDACIVLLTGCGTADTGPRAARCGVDLYFTKPVALPELLQAMGVVITGRWTCQLH